MENQGILCGTATSQAIDLVRTYLPDQQAQNSTGASDFKKEFQWSSRNPKNPQYQKLIAAEVERSGMSYYGDVTDEERPSAHQTLAQKSSTEMGAVAMTRRPPRPSVTRLPQPPPLLVSDAFTQQCLRQINEGEVLTLGEIAERIKSQTGVCAASSSHGNTVS